MKKKVALWLMAALMLFSLTACGGGDKPKDEGNNSGNVSGSNSGDEQLDEDLEKKYDLICFYYWSYEEGDYTKDELKDTLAQLGLTLKEAEKIYAEYAYEFGYKEAETEAETQPEISDYGVADIDVENVNPYETNIFEVLGLDKDFPAPEKIEHTWNYHTWKSESTNRDPKTGDLVENPHEFKLTLHPNESLYENYLIELDEYLTQKSDVQSDQNWDKMKSYWLKDGMQIVIEHFEGNVLIIAYPTKPVHIEGIVTRLDKEYKYILDENGEAVEIPYPNSFSVETDSVSGMEAPDNKIHVNQIYSCDEKGYATEARVNFVNGEMLQEGSRVIIDTVITDNPYYPIMLGSLTAGEQIGQTTITVLE